MNLGDKSRAITAEDLIRRYKLDALSKDRKVIKTIDGVLTKTNAIIEKYIKILSKYTKNQAKITAWFFSGIPTIENEPFISFKDEVDKHINDLYYDRNTGYVYQLNVEHEVYNWTRIEDNELIEVLALANSSADTYDNMRNTFYDIPTPPYQIGDIWYNGSKIYRCRCNRTEGSYQETDWCLQEEYSDSYILLDTTAILDQFKKEVIQDYVSKAQLETTTNQILGVVESTTTKLTTQMEGYATNESVEVINQKVENVQTSTSQVITVVQDIQKNGVTQVRTEKGFTFNNDGMTIDEINSPTKSVTDTDGVKVIDKTGNQDKELLFAGYDEELLQSIVRTMNLWVKTYLTLGDKNASGDWRLEIIEDSTYGIGVGFFYMRGDS